MVRVVDRLCRVVPRRLPGEGRRRGAGDVPERPRAGRVPQRHDKPMRHRRMDRQRELRSLPSDPATAQTFTVTAVDNGADDDDGETVTLEFDHGA